MLAERSAFVPQLTVDYQIVASRTSGQNAAFLMAVLGGLALLLASAAAPQAAGAGGGKSRSVGLVGSVRSVQYVRSGQSGKSAAPVVRLGKEALALPSIGDHALRIITPTLLELSLVSTKSPNSRVDRWDFIEDNGTLHVPARSQFRVTAAGTQVSVAEIGFKRRVRYAPLKVRDLRIGNCIYLRLTSPIPDGAVVEVTNPDSKVWAASLSFSGRADIQRYSPAIHVNQAGYMPGEAKMGLVGYYLGSMGEMPVSGLSRFNLVDVRTGKVVYSTELKPRPDRGWTYPTPQYQQVLAADFSAWKTPGEYRLQVAALGSSLPFRIDEGTAALFARTYALGLYHQRCGAENALPFTRFVHGPCHTAPADVPTMANRSVQRQLSGESANYKSNPRHTAPQLKDVNSSLYPYVRQGTVDVSGGHHDAGDYSKYTINSAALIHSLVFAADNFPGAGDLDNLGIPESGDGKSDLLQIAKWEADFLAKMQDTDGGFYFLVYPRGRAYENDVLPDHGDTQVVFPKTTSVTAAATAALAQAASSPRFKRNYPEVSARYLRAAKKGWVFLERAFARYGRDGSYQKITHYGDTFMHDDEVAWAAAELFLATGESKYHDELRSHFDPADKETMHWGWERLFDSYGCAIRSYAFGAKSGRVTDQQLDPAYLAKCRTEIIAGGDDHVSWATDSAYGTSFPIESKRFRTAGWYFSTAQAFDIAVAEVLNPRPDRMQAILTNINYEAGCNPNNIAFLTGVGWQRQREIVHHYAMNDRRVLPPSGIPLGSIQEGFMYLEKYGKELGALTYPGDGSATSPYPFYDRWGDSFNVATEFTIPIQGRCLAVTAWLMARSSLKAQKWRTAQARLVGLPDRVKSGVPFTVSLQAPGLDSSDAQIVWEASGNEPRFGQTFTFTPAKGGAQWIEAEALWPDGRRVSAALEFNATD